jgi:hypothetical protein
MTRLWRFARFRALELSGGKRRASVRSMSDLVCSVMWCLLGLLVPPAVAQEKPLERSFLAGMSASYRIQLLVRSEIQGQQPVQIGAKTYVKPFLREAHGRLSWRATQHVISVNADGTADIEEVLDEAESAQASGSSADEETEKLVKAVREAFEKWGVMRVLRYHETRAGQLTDLSPDGAPPLEEASPPVLTLWLLRALRPGVALPAAPIRFGELWQEPRTAQLPHWADVRGSEAGGWLAATGFPEPAARLHLVQQLSGTVVSGVEKPPEGTVQARFHAESLNTVSLSDGRLMAATRSATREITWTLPPVKGLREQPEFRGRLSVEVQIEACNDSPCLSPKPGRSALGERE